MKKVLGSLLRQFIFWILLFDVSRLLFILYYANLIKAGHLPFSSVMGVFFWSLHLDAAVACYFLVIPFLLLAIQLLIRKDWPNLVNRIYAGLVILAYSLASIGELGIYREWKSKLTYKALLYLAHPSEVYNSVETGTFFLLLLLFILMAGGGIFVYLKWFGPRLHPEKKSKPWAMVAFFILMPALLATGMRGGVSPVPINQSQSYFSKHEILNHIAVNNLFSLFVSIFENYTVMEGNPYIFMEQARAERIVKEIYTVPKDTTVSILTTPRPNIVMLILESYSADLIESLGAKPGITPEFKQLEEEGILFTQVYTSGMRSEQGMASLFAGFPSHPHSCSVIQPEKYHALPSFPAVLKKNGYTTSFYFGGQLIYGNIKGYIYYNKFDKIIEGDDYPKSVPRGKLGIPDGYMLDDLAGDLPRQKRPFFTVLFTISSHSPYDQPYERPLDWGGTENDYINSAYYTDHCLGEFFNKVRKLPLYDSTLFILVADHSHSSYYNWYPGQREYRHIPLLMTGGALKPAFRGTRWEKLGNQHDLPATILAQMVIPGDEFTWSKNLLNPYSPEFAYFSNENGFGWIRPGIQYSMDLGKDWIYSYDIPPAFSDSIRREGEAYLQVLFGEYLAQ